MQETLSFNIKSFQYFGKLVQKNINKTVKFLQKVNNGIIDGYRLT